MKDVRIPAGEPEPSGTGSEHEETQYLGPVPSPQGGRSGEASSPHSGERVRGGSPVGSRVGSIRVEKRLAEGGVGELYVGFDETLRRKVALKALRGDRRSVRWRSRLLREARILSRLQDPKICQIHGYLEGDGTDYLILELIEGRTLRQAVEEDLSPALRMRIAVQIAEVLAKAHANGVIHRDLKPSNVMLTPDGSVKVLDFGIASSAEDDPTGAEDGRSRDRPAEELPPAAATPSAATLAREGFLTQTGSVLGTLSYMSPEQARGETLASASDVFSFGLLLQELFTGRRAYDRSMTPEELAQRVLVGESLPVGGLGRDLAALIGRMKAIAPEERPTAAAVAERLCFIRDKPRRRLRRIAGAAVALALALALLFHVRGLRKERNLALASEQKAVAARLEAEKVVEFLEGMFQVSDPRRSVGETITAREVLDRGSAQIEEELGDQPLVQARLMATMGSVYFRLGFFDRSEELLERALELRRTALPAHAPEIADSAGRLGAVRNELSEYRSALELYEEAAAIHEGAFGPESRERVSDLLGLAAALTGLSHYEEAQVLDRQALAILEAMGELKTLEAGTALRSLANLHRHQGRYEEALPYYERVRDLNEVLGPESYGAGMTLYNLGITYTQMGRYEEAEPVYLRCREIWKKTAGPEHSDIAKIDLALATLYRRQDRFEEAEETFKQAMAIWETSVGRDNPYMGLAANNLASVYLEQERFDEADTYYRRALEIFEASYEAGHPNISMTLANLGQLAWARGRYDDAEGYLRRALAADEELSGPEHPNVGWDLHLLANVERDRGRYAEAEALYQRSFAILEPALGADHPDLVAAYQERDLLKESPGTAH